MFRRFGLLFHRSSIIAVSASFALSSARSGLGLHHSASTSLCLASLRHALRRTCRFNRLFHTLPEPPQPWRPACSMYLLLMDVSFVLADPAFHFGSSALLVPHLRGPALVSLHSCQPCCSILKLSAYITYKVLACFCLGSRAGAFFYSFHFPLQLGPFS